MESPNKCIKCKKYGVKLINFQYTKIKRRVFSKIGTDYIINLQVCESCREDILAFKKFDDYYEEHKFNFIYFLIIILIWVFSFVILQNFNYQASRIIYFGSLILFILYVIGVLNIGIKILIKFVHPHRVTKFLKLKGRKNTFSKELKYLEENESLNGVLTELQINGRHEEEKRITCPGCGAIYNDFIDFCNSCGKDLRNFYS
ncbi:MAG: hypothetical protein ACFFDF_03295 [Candidatus Odinarchaeota archaeon]